MASYKTGDFVLPPPCQPEPIACAGGYPYVTDRGPMTLVPEPGRASPEFVESSAFRPLVLPVQPMPSFSSRQLFTQEVDGMIGSVVQERIDHIKRKICKETTVRLMEKMPHEGWPDQVQDDQDHVGMLVMCQMDKKHNEMDRMQGVIMQLQNENMRLKLKLEQEQARRKKRPARVSKAKRDLAVSPGWFIGHKPLHVKRISNPPPHTMISR